MAKRLNDARPVATPATPATPATRGGRPRTPSLKEEYGQAVALAFSAIEASKTRPRLKFDRSPKALAAKMQEKLAKGETLTASDWGALEAAVAELAAPRKRGRGRPNGARNHAAYAAFQAAAFAVEGATLKTYRNGATGHRLTRCDAIADAMVAAGFRNFATYAAVEKQMRGLRRSLNNMKRNFKRMEQSFFIKALLPLRKLGEALSQNGFSNVSRALSHFETAVAKNHLQQAKAARHAFSRQMQDLGKAAATLGQNVRAATAFGEISAVERQMQEIGKTTAAIGQHMRAATALSDKTRSALEKQIQTK